MSSKNVAPTSTVTGIDLPQKDFNVKPTEWIMNDFLDASHIGDRYHSESYYTEMTPQLCGFLQNHLSKNNRKTRGDVVERLARDIKNGNWRKTCDTFKIVFVRDNADGTVKPVVGDANHRVRAFWKVWSETGSIPKGCFVRLSACQPIEISRFTDINRTRSTNDSMRIEGVDPDFAPISNDLGYIFREKINGQVSKNEAFHCAEIYGHPKSVVEKVLNDKFAGRNFARKAVWPLMSAILAVWRVRNFDDRTIEAATEFVFINVERAFGFSSANAGTRDERIFVSVLKDAKGDKANSFNGYKNIKQVGISTVALLENVFCGAHHKVAQKATSRYGRTVCVPDDDILAAYTPDAVL